MVGVLGSYLLIRAARDVFPWLIGRKSLKSFSRPGDLVVLIGTLTLPLAGASIGIFQDVLGLTLTNPDSSVAPHGLPIGSGLFVAFAVVAVVLITSLVIGLRWKGNGALEWLAFAAAWGMGLFLLMTAISVVSGNSQMEYYSLLEYFPPIAVVGVSVGAIGVGIWRKGWWLVSFAFSSPSGPCCIPLSSPTRRSGHWHLAIPGVLDRTARRGKGKSTLVLLHSNRPELRIPSYVLGGISHTAVCATRRFFQPFPGVLGGAQLPPLHLCQRKDALAAGRCLLAVPGPGGEAAGTTLGQ